MKPCLLLIGSFLSADGGSRSVGEELAVRLAGAGYPVFMASSRRPPLARLLDMLLAAWRRRSEYQLAYVEVFSGPAFHWAEAVTLLLRALHKPFALALHGGRLPIFAMRHPRRVKRLLGSANAVVAPSRYLLEGLYAFREDIRIIPNPIELEDYPFRLRSNPRPRLVWLRAFHSLYNPQLAVHVVAALSTVFPDVSLTMIGPDKGDGSLESTQNLARDLGVTDRIQIIGAVTKSEVPGCLDQGDIFINTTNVDNTPVSVMEAMACGLCIVSTSVGGIPYLLEHEQDALLVPPHDAWAMASAVRRILTEPGLAERLSRNARRKAEQYDWSVVLPQWKALFEEIACGKV